jgi:hypothetical protein
MANTAVSTDTAPGAPAIPPSASSQDLRRRALQRNQSRRIPKALSPSRRDHQGAATLRRT